MTDQVTRYSMQDRSRGYDSWQELVRDPDGDWVSYEDYAKIVRENARLKERLMTAANTCDTWARESRAGGWSTHQVAANENLANDLRRTASFTGS